MSLILRRVPAVVVAVGVAVAVAFALGWSPPPPGGTTGRTAATSHSQRPTLAAGAWDGGWTRHVSAAAFRPSRAAPATRPVSTAATPDTPATRPVSTAGTRTTPATRTTASAAAGGSERKGLAPAAMALLLIAGAVVGVVVGLVPAMLLAFLFGVRPPFRRRAEAEAAEPRLVAVPLLVPQVAPGADVDTAAVPEAPEAPDVPDEPDVPAAEVPEAPLAGPGPVLISMPAPGAGQAERPVPPSAPERHRALYDTEYARQLERLEALRQSIGAGVGRDTVWPSGRPREPRRNGNGPRPAGPDQSTSRNPS